LFTNLFFFYEIVPTGSQKLQITLTYIIKTVGVSAEQISEGTDNDISDDLIEGIRIILMDMIDAISVSESRSLQVLNYSETSESKMVLSTTKALIDNKVSHSRRKLAMYSASAPPFHSLVAPTGKKINHSSNF